MKLGDETLLVLVDIFRRAIVEMKDISDDLRQLDLELGADGKLHVKDESGSPRGH